MGVERRVTTWAWVIYRYLKRRENKDLFMKIKEAGEENWGK